MQRGAAISCFLLLFLIAYPATAQAQPDKEAKIANALSAGPPSIAEGAAVVDHDGTLLREGSNGWTCFPANPAVPANNPACLDDVWVAFFKAWKAGEAPPASDRLGFGYMLQGGAVPSMTDPLATEPPEGEEWKIGGPHIMVTVPDPGVLEGLPTKPTAAGPWVMWKGTPYAHIMMPAPKK